MPRANIVQTASRIGGPYRDPPPTPPVDFTATDRSMSMIPTHEFYRHPQKATASAVQKPADNPKTPQLSLSSIGEGKSGKEMTEEKPRKKKFKKSHNSSIFTTGPDKPSANSSNLTPTPPKGQSSPLTKWSDKGTDSSSHRQKTRRPVSPAPSLAGPAPADSVPKISSPKSRETPPTHGIMVPSPDDAKNSLMEKKKRRHQDQDEGPSRVPSGVDIEKSTEVSKCDVGALELHPPGSSDASGGSSVDNPRKKSKRRERSEGPIIGSILEKKRRKSSSKESKSSRPHYTNLLEDSTPSTEACVDNRPASLKISKKRRRDKSPANPSATKRRRNTTSSPRPEPFSHHGADEHVIAEEEPSATPAPGPSKRSKGKRRASTPFQPDSALMDDSAPMGIMNDSIASTGSSDEFSFLEVSSPRLPNAGELSSPEGIVEGKHDTLQHLATVVQRPRGRTLPPVPSFPQNRLLDRGFTPWLDEKMDEKMDEKIDKKVKAVLDIRLASSQRSVPTGTADMPPPPLLLPDPGAAQNVFMRPPPNDDQIVALIKDRTISPLNRYSCARNVFTQKGIIRPMYSYIKKRVSEEDWARVANKKRYRASRRQSDP